jgi:hypothetical protein
MDIFSSIAEQKIAEAMKNGEFDNLPGKGKPVPPDDMSHVPEELRIGYKVLKNAGIVPEEVHLNKEIVSLERLILFCRDDEEKKELNRKLTEKRLRFNMLMEERKMANSPAFARYEGKLRNRFYSPIR